MGSVLYTLFSGDYDITPKRDKKQQNLSKASLAEWDKITAVFGKEFVDNLFFLEAECEENRNFQYYRFGFLLGARLMLEALNQPSI